MRKSLIVLGACALLLVGCASSGGDDGKKVEDLEKQVADLKAAASSTTEATGGTTAPSTTTKVPTTAAPTTTTPPTTAPPTTAPPASLMPDVVCMNLQDAQDYIQSTTDVFLSLSEDATGQGRSQIMDSNWIVVAQRPAPGTPIGEGDAVLSVVKIGEPNDC